MPKIELDLNPVDFITVDALGKPGERVFFLQARSNTQTVSLLIEKIQVESLFFSAEEFYEELKRDNPHLPDFSVEYTEDEMHIVPPVTSLFRIGRLTLGYEPESNRIILAAHEILGSDQTTEDVSEIRFWCTVKQFMTLAQWGKEVASRGRQICPLCGQPMDPEGHLCPKKNGHSH